MCEGRWLKEKDHRYRLGEIVGISGIVLCLDKGVGYTDIFIFQY